MFDVSHMGILTLTGGSAADLLSRRTTANVPLLRPGQSRYTFLCEFSGAIVDDLLVTRLDAGIDPPPGFLAVPNAGQAEFVFELLLQHRKPDTRIERWNHKVAIVAVQGPASREILEQEFGWSLSPLKFYEGRRFPFTADGRARTEGDLGMDFTTDLTHSVWVGRTGYTGELGFEVFVGADNVASLWKRLRDREVVPCGLGARDTLRLEKGYLLSGQDFHRDHTPLEAAQDRFVSFDHPFVGRPPMEVQQRDGVPVRLVGLRTDVPGAIPRHGTPVRQGETTVGTVTSGTQSPTLGVGIALAYLPPGIGVVGNELGLELHGRVVPAKVVAFPFLPAPSGRR